MLVRRGSKSASARHPTVHGHPREGHPVERVMHALAQALTASMCLRSLLIASSRLAWPCAAAPGMFMPPCLSCLLMHEVGTAARHSNIKGCRRLTRHLISTRPSTPPPPWRRSPTRSVARLRSRGWCRRDRCCATGSSYSPPTATGARWRWACGLIAFFDPWVGCDMPAIAGSLLLDVLFRVLLFRD
jgi:hypothetical protein